MLIHYPRYAINVICNNHTSFFVYAHKKMALENLYNNNEIIIGCRTNKSFSVVKNHQMLSFNHSDVVISPGPSMVVMHNRRFRSPCPTHWRTFLLTIRPDSMVFFSRNA